MSKQIENENMSKWDKIKLVKDFKAFDYVNQQLKTEQRIAAMRKEMDAHEREIAKKLIDLKDSFKKIKNGAGSKKITRAVLIHKINNYMVLEKQLDNVLSVLGLQPIPALGNLVDENLHFVEQTIEKPSSEDGIIVEIIEEGYMIRDFVVRPAHVIVVKNR